MHVDCQTCPVRQTHCDDCMVTALQAISPLALPLDHAEQTAMGVLVAAGLVTAEEAASASARRELWPGLASVG